MGKPVADDLFRAPAIALPAIDIGGIEEIDAQLQRPVHDREAVFYRRMRTEIHRAQAQVAHQHAVFAESSVFNSHILHHSLSVKLTPVLKFVANAKDMVTSAIELRYVSSPNCPCIRVHFLV